MSDSWDFLPFYVIFTYNRLRNIYFFVQELSRAQTPHALRAVLYVHVYSINVLTTLIYTLTVELKHAQWSHISTCMITNQVGAVGKPQAC